MVAFNLGPKDPEDIHESIRSFNCDDLLSFLLERTSREELMKRLHAYLDNGSLDWRDVYQGQIDPIQAMQVYGTIIVTYEHMKRAHEADNDNPSEEQLAVVKSVLDEGAHI